LAVTCSANGLQIPILDESRDAEAADGVKIMRKTGILLIALTAVGLYFWFSGDEPAEPKLSQPVPPSQPVWRAPPTTREPARESGSWRGSAYWEPQTAQEFPTQPHGGNPYRSQQPNGTVGSHTTQLGDYRFRPLDDREREKIDRQRPADYPGYRPGPTDPTYRGAPESPGVEGFARPYAMQDPAQGGYTFRPYDAERAAKSWTGNYPAPGGYAPEPMQNPYAAGPYAQDPWSNPNRPLSGYGPLWAAGGAAR